MFQTFTLVGVKEINFHTEIIKIGLDFAVMAQ